MRQKGLGLLGWFESTFYALLFLTVHKFSTREQGYTVSDCTGEGLKAVLDLQFELELVLALLFSVSLLIWTFQVYPQTHFEGTFMRRRGRFA